MPEKEVCASKQKKRPYRLCCNDEAHSMIDGKDER
jgi:hypothetical protein